MSASRRSAAARNVHLHESRRERASSKAEARLAVRFLAEESLETAAQRLGISIDTARNQLESVYQKTGVRRQGEIIALLSRLARF